MDLTISAAINPATGYQSAAAFEESGEGEAINVIATLRMKSRWFRLKTQNEFLKQSLLANMEAMLYAHGQFEHWPSSMRLRVEIRDGSWLIVVAIAGVWAFLKDYNDVREGALQLLDDISFVARKAFHAAHKAARRDRRILGGAKRPHTQSASVKKTIAVKIRPPEKTGVPAPAVIPPKLVDKLKKAQNTNK